MEGKLRPKSVLSRIIDNAEIKIADCIKWFLYGIAAILIALSFLINSIKDDRAPVEIVRDKAISVLELQAAKNSKET